MLTKEVLDHNIAKVKEQLRRLLDFDTPTNPARLLDNATWTAPVSFLDFLRDIGKHFSVNQMVAKESVRARMEDREAGISYTEFSYMLLQAFDFYVLCRDYNCELQIGGSDQWGNITAGIDLTRKKLGRTVFGLTLPLITNADGTKFGKTDAGAVWLDPARTSVYKFYQFWIRTDDRDVVRYLKFFTFLSQDEIAALEKQHTENPGARAAHKALAKAVTDLVHGPERDGGGHARQRNPLRRRPGRHLRGHLQRNRRRSAHEGNREGANSTAPASRWSNCWCTAASAPPRARRARTSKAAASTSTTIREASFQRAVTAKDLLFGKHLLLRKGKRNYVVLTVR